MANALLTPKVYANAMLLLLRNNLVMGRLVETDLNNLNPKMKGVTHKKGDTIYIKRRPKFDIRSGATIDVQDIEIGEVPLTIDQQKGIDIEFGDLEFVNSVDDLLMNAIMQEEAAAIAQEIDSDLAGMVKTFPSWVGTPGETINSAVDFFKGPERLDLMAVPQDRHGVLSPTDYWGLAGNFTSLYAQDKVAMDALTKAKLPIVGSVQPYMTQNVPNLTLGSRAGTITVNGADQNVTYATCKNTWTQTVILQAVTASKTFVVGDTFTMAGVNALNPSSKLDAGYLQQFVVTEAATADGSGDVTLTISPPMITSGPFRNVTAAPADNASVTPLGTASTAYPQNAIFHKRAMALVFVKPKTPDSGKYSFATDPETGIIVRYWRASDFTNDTHGHRWDVLYGYSMIDNRLGTRISGTA